MLEKITREIERSFYSNYHIKGCALMQKEI